MRSESGVVGFFQDPGRAADAVRALRAAGHLDVRAASPAAYPGLVEALGRPRSRLDGVVLAAAASGVAGGFALSIGTSIAWPLLTGGMPIVSLPPFVIVAFELSVLVGALVNLAALLLLGSRARRRRSVPPDGRFTADRIGVFVPGGDLSRAETILREGGAEEVRRVP